MRLLLAFLLLLMPAQAWAQNVVRVRIVTSMGAITLALDAKRAPKTVANFLMYVDDGRLEGTEFYRAARSKNAPGLGFIQGGIAQDVRRSLRPIPLEQTNVTGIKHTDGAISMAHGPEWNSATGNFSIMVGANPSLDASGEYRGFAAFGHVIGGMDVVKRILALPSGGGEGAMRGQMIVRPVTIVRAERLDGVAKPTGYVKPWLMERPKIYR